MFKRILSIAASFCLLIFTSVAGAENLILTIASGNGVEQGKVVIQLYTDKAPNHVARIKQLVQDGSYNGVAFHRVIQGFMAQTGDVQYGNIKNYNERKVGTGNSQYKDVKAEFSTVPYVEGIVGMARSRYIHSANSQFFIMFDAHGSLNGQYTVIGGVVDGMDVVHRIKKGASNQNGTVMQPDYIKSAVIQF